MRRLVFASFAIAVSGCNCDEVVGSRIPEAELSFNDDISPPLPHLEIALGAVQVGVTTSANVQLESVGTLPLTVASVSLVAHPELCPNPSGEYRLPATLPPLSLKPS